MTRRFTGSALRLLSLLLGLLLTIGVFTVAMNQGWLSPLGVGSESHDSQVIQAIERTEEVSLLSLGIQGIKSEKKCTEALGGCVPGTSETLFLQYNFTAKLGIDGAEVEVTQTDEDHFLVKIPQFISIGFDQPTFKVAAEDDGALSWITPEVNETEMVNEILSDDAKQGYIDTNELFLQDQAQVFYDSLITSIAPDAVTTYEFDS